MIVVLLLTIIMILLFGSGAILGAAGAVLTAVCVLIVGLAFWSAGWIGVVALSGIIGIAVTSKMNAASAKRRSMEEGFERALKQNREQASQQENAADARRAIEHNKLLDAEYRAKVERNRQSRS